MICPNCKYSYMLQHPERRFAKYGWRKCSICGFSCIEGDYCVKTGEKIDTKSEESRDRAIEEAGGTPETNGGAVEGNS